MIHIRLLPITLACSFFTTGYSETLINWNLNTVNYPNFPDPAVNNAPFTALVSTAATVAPQLSTSDLVSVSTPGHSGLVWSGGNPGPNELNLQRWDHPNDNPAQSGNGNGNPNNWLQFTLTAAAGNSFTLQKINLRAWRNGIGAPSTWLFQTSTDNGQNWISFGSSHNETNVGDAVFRPVTFTDSLTATSLLIRFAATGPTGGTGNLHLNLISLEGTVQSDNSNLPLASVDISPNIPLISPETEIALNSPSPDVDLFYTLDGSTPTRDSQPYLAPFQISPNTTVKAVAINQNNEPGPVATRSYKTNEPIGTPNLVLIIADSIGYGDLHCYGGVTVDTPALDSLAYDGIRFTQFTTTGPGPAPFQYSLLTGRIPPRSGLNASPSPPGSSGWQSEEWSLAEMLRRQGYATAFIGEWLLGNARGSHPNDQGFQLFHGLPFHHLENPPLVENQNILNPNPDPTNLLNTLTQRATTFIDQATQPFALIFQPPPLPAAGDSLAGPHGNRLEALDSATQEILASLDAKNLTSQTLVIFLSNGGAPRTSEGGSNGLLRDGKGTTWEGGMRAPFIARLPDTLPAGQINLSLLWLPDLFPTLTSLVDGTLASDRPVDGAARPDSLTATTTRPGDLDTAFGFRFLDDKWQVASVRRGPWKSHLLYENIDPENNNPTSGNQLFQLHLDAEERINRATEEPAVLTELATLANSLTFPATFQTDLPAPKKPITDEVSHSFLSPTTLQYQFTRPTDSLDDHYQLQHTTNLISWTSSPITPYLTAITPSLDSLENVLLTIPLDPPPFLQPKSFIRLSANRPANQ